MDLVVHQRPSPDGTVIVVAGELDLATLPRLRQQLAAAIAASPPGGRVVVDLDDAGVIDPVALGVLLDARVRVLDRGGSIELACARPRVLGLLERTGLTAVFPVRPPS